MRLLILKNHEKESGMKLAVGQQEAPIIETHEEFVEYTENSQNGIPN